MEFRTEQMVAEHTGLVKSIALRLSYVYGEEFEDLMQIGYIGLLKAIKGFDESKGFKFSTYAVPVITGEIKAQLRDQGRIKVSRSIKADVTTVKRAEEKFNADNNRSPRISELVAMTGLGEDRVKQALQAQDALRNMEELENVKISIKEEEQNITKIDLWNCLDKLEKVEKQIMVLRYYKDMTQSQVAKVLGMSQVQISRIEKKTLKSMAKIMVI